MKFLILSLCAIVAMATPPHNTPASRPASVTGNANVTRWEAASIRPAWIPALDKAVWQYQRDRARYLVIERQRRGGVPAAVVFGFHGRESTWSFSRHLHEGSPLTHRTRDVPKGRPLHPDPPYTFEQSAEDALYVLKREDLVNWSDSGTALDAIEAYNGTGYRSRKLPSPYLWSGTDRYERGKFIRDHVYSPTALDQQPGVAALLIRMRQRGVAIPF